MDRRRLDARLRDRYDADERTRRVVVRQAGDLADSGRLAADLDYALSVEDVLDNLADAPNGYSLVERWNWWIGSLELAHGGYDRFLIRDEFG